MRYLLLAFFAFVSISTLSAQQNLVEVDSVVVAARSVTPLVKQSTPVQRISSERFEMLGMTELHDVINTFSGVQINNYGGVGGMKTVSVRSLGSQHTSVSYDGVTMSNAQGGSVDIGDIMLNNIEDVSLSIGQSDDIFQPARNFALTGLVAIRTKVPTFVDKSVNASVGCEFGSFGLYNPSLYTAVKLSDRWSATLNGNYMISDGDYPFTLTNGVISEERTRENSDVHRGICELNLYGTLDNGAKVQIKGSYLNSERGLPGGVIYHNVENNGERTWGENGVCQVGYKDDLGDRWSLDLNAKYTYDYSHYASKYGADDRYTQQEYYVSSALLYKLDNGLSFGYSQDIYQNILDGNRSNLGNPKRFNLNGVVSAKYSNRRLTIVGSMFLLYNHEWTDNDAIAASPDRRRFSPSLSASYQLLRHHDLRLRASAKDGFRIPTLNDLYYDAIGNNTLEPEKAKMINVGLSYGCNLFEYTTLSIDGYYNKIEDKIIAIPKMFYWTMVNLGEVEMKGVDANFNSHIRLFKDLKLNISGNYSYQYAVDVTDPDSGTYLNQIAYTPLHSGNGAATLSYRGFDLGYTLTYMGERYSNNQNIDIFYLMESYVQQDMSLSKGLNIKGIELNIQAKVLNMTDVEYDIIQFYPMPGRQYRLSLTLKY